MRWSSRPRWRALSAGYLPFASCTRFSPKVDWPAAIAASIAASSWVFETAIKVISRGSRFAAFAAFPMRVRTSARLAAMVSAITLVDMAGVETLNEARGKLARKARQLNARHGRGCAPALILMTDDAREADWPSAVRALPPGSAVIVRHRDARAREDLARRLRPICAVRRIKMLIADDARLALRVRADGVHLPEKHVGRVDALRALHRHWFVSTSAHNVRAMRAAARADAVLIAPAFPTASHPGRPALGPLRVAALAAQTRAAAYALGGIDATSIQRLSAARLGGVALIGGWTKA